jgi:predicted acylesterase/phospholipase RssA
MYDIQNFIFDSGGLSGFSELLGLYHLHVQQKDIIQKVQRFGGTSVGSLIAILCLLGLFDPTLTNSVIFETICKIRQRFIKTADTWNPSILVALWRIFYYKGIMSGSCMDVCLQSIIDEDLAVLNSPTYNNVRVYAQTKFKKVSQLTMSELYDATDNKVCVITTHNIQTFQNLYVHHLNNPNLPIVHAMAASMNFPFIFEPRKDVCIADQPGGWFVDGGILEKFPIWLFSHDGSLPTKNFRQIPKTDISSNTLGFKNVRQHESQLQPHPNPNMSLFEYVRRVVFTSLAHGQDGVFMTEPSSLHVLGLPSIGSIDLENFKKEDVWTQLVTDTEIVVHAWLLKYRES